MKKISFTGTHGTGKSTAVFKLAHKMKIENPGKKVGVFMDNARNCPYGFNKNKPEQAQMWIFCNQLIKELELSLKYDILITDRTIFDPIAYTYVFKQKDLADKMFYLGVHHMNSYDKIILKSIQNNNYLIKEGEDRDTDDIFYQQAVERELIRIYQNLKRIGATFEFIID